MEAGFKLLPTGSANLPSASELQGTVWRNSSLSGRRRPSTTEPLRTLRDTSCLSFCARPALHRACASLTSLLARGFRPRRPSPRSARPVTRQLVRLSFARAKKLARAAECLVYSLTPSGFWAENHPKNRGFVGILRGQNAGRDVFHGDLLLESGLAARARCLGFLAGVAAVSRPRSSATATMQLYFRRSGSSRDTVLQNQVERAA